MHAGAGVLLIGEAVVLVVTLAGGRTFRDEQPDEEAPFMPRPLQPDHLPAPTRRRCSISPIPWTLPPLTGRGGVWQGAGRTPLPRRT